MTDPKRPYLEMQGMAASCETNVMDATRWLLAQVNGWPRAQDFEPTGHGGSDPTGMAGLHRDTAAATLKEIERRKQRVWNDLRWLEDTFNANVSAIRPDFDASDPNEYCRVHLTELEEYVYRDTGDLCRSCYERVLALRKKGLPEDITAADLRHHARKGRWPTKPVDPKVRVDVMRIASVDRLQLHAVAMTAEQAANVLLEGAG